MVFQNQIPHKSQMLSFLDDEKEFEAQTFRIDSTHEYFKTCEYELLTPSELGDRSNSFFDLVKKIQSFFTSAVYPGNSPLKW